MYFPKNLHRFYGYTIVTTIHKAIKNAHIFAGFGIYPIGVWGFIRLNDRNIIYSDIFTVHRMNRPGW